MKARKKVSRPKERLDFTIYLYCTIRHPRKYNNHYTTTLLLDMTMTVRFGFAFLVGGGKEGRNNAKHLSSWFAVSKETSFSVQAVKARSISRTRKLSVEKNK